MPLYIDTRGYPNLAIGICGRCSRKFPLALLVPDGNVPGLRVCPEDRDVLDPWRLPAREAERITVDYPRPDVPVDSPGPTFLYTPQMQPDGISAVAPAAAWQALTGYARGQSITPLPVDADTTVLPQYWFVAQNAGKSGATPPQWPTHAGIITLDGTIFWQCLGIFPM